MWALKFKGCIKCGTTERRHLGRGLCVNCYHIDIESRYKPEKGSRRWIKRDKKPHRILTQEHLLKEYFENNKSLGDIAKEAKCSRQYVHKMLKLCGKQLRDKTSARTLALDRGKIVVTRTNDSGTPESLTFHKIRYNKDFFSHWTPEMAYVLGVIYTDGDLTAGKLRDPSTKTTSLVPRVGITQKDPELLLKIKVLMECDAKLNFNKQRSVKLKKENREVIAGPVYRLNLHGDELYDQLLCLGLFPQKSLIIEFPNIPSQFVRHFIRGCWDGDGSIFFENETGNKVASFVSGSQKFIQGLLTELEKAGLPKRNIYESKGKNISYYFRFTGRQCDQLYHFMYDGVPPSQYLTRKYELFKK